MQHHIYSEKLDKALEEIKLEVANAKTVYPDYFVNQHEAYAVIVEEVGELWDEIKKNQKKYDLTAQRKEAKQGCRYAGKIDGGVAMIFTLFYK